MPGFAQRQKRPQISQLVRVARDDLSTSRLAPITHPLLVQQQAIGNQAFQRLLRSRVIQPKLTIGKPGDQYEREADRVADAMIRMPETRLQFEPQKNEKKKENLLQTKGDSTKASEIVPDIDKRIQSLKGSGQSLPQAERQFFESRFGRDFSSVRVHVNSDAAQIASALNAKAFTIGGDIAFGEGQYRLGTYEGRNLLSHELAHVIQQENNNRLGLQLNRFEQLQKEIYYYGEIFIEDPKKADEFEKEFVGEKYDIEIEGKQVEIESGTIIANGKFICRDAGAVYNRFGDQIRKYSYADFIVRQLPTHISNSNLYQGLKVIIPIAQFEALLVMCVFRPDLLIDVAGNIIAGKSIVDEEAMRGYLASTLFGPLGKIKVSGRILGRATEILVEATKSAAESAFQELLKGEKLEAGKLTEDILKSTISSQIGKVIADLPVDDKRVLKEVNDKLREIGGALISKEAAAAYETGKEAITK